MPGHSAHKQVMRAERFTTHPVHRAIAACIRSGVPVHIVGSPGQGKTALLQQWSSKWGRHVEVVTGSSRDKGDFMGMPVEDGGKVQYSPPAWVRNLQNAPEGMLVLDELHSASESFDISLRIVQERVVGEAPLPETVSVVAISNPVDEAVNGEELPGPVANRFIHTGWHSGFETWAEGLLTNFTGSDGDAVKIAAELGDAQAQESNYARIVGEVIQFLRLNPGLRNEIPTDLVAAGQGWPSDRSWHNLARAVAHLHPRDEEAIHLLVVGAVGEAAAISFTEWRLRADLHDPAAVLEDPSIVDWHAERPDRLFSLLNSIRALVLARNNTTKVWQRGMGAVTACAVAGKPDVALPAARAMISAIPKGAKISDETREVFEGLLGRVGQVEAANL